MNDTPATPIPTGPAASGKATPYRVLARKYRPQNFDDLIGQEPMVRTLTNAFATGRIAQAYMLTGVRGVGKTTTARILARALNYEREGIDAPTIDVRQEGEHCRAIMEGRHVDVIEMDAASHTGIDDIRDIIESVQYAPAIARYKVYIIDEVHMLSRNAFNGLLKTLEEPPEHLKFVFATTEIRKVPVTVLSRCQRFDLRRIDAGTMAAHLAKIATSEKVEIEDDALALVARGAEGSVRDALSILDQAIAHSAGRIEAASVRAMLGLADRARVIDLFEQLMRGDIAAALAELRDQYDIGADPAVVLADLADFVHYVTRLKYVPNPADDVALPETERRRGAEFAASLSVRTLARAWQILLKGIEEVGASERALAAADMVLVRLAHAASLPAPDELIRMLGEDKAGGSPQSGPGGAAQAGPGAGRGASAQAASPGFSRPSAQATQDTGQRAAMREARPEMRAEPAEAPASAPMNAPAIALDGFDDLILLAEDKRDIKLKTMLRRNLRLVAFRDGHIEFNLAGDPPKTFMNDLSQKLLQWTGRRWTLAVSREGGMPTLEEQEQAEMGERTEAARADPVVEAILTRFPGSRIVDIKMREAEPGELPPEQAAEEAERREGLDDFLE